MMAGKGDRPRPGVYSQEYKQNHERIFGKKKKKGKEIKQIVTFLQNKVKVLDLINNTN